MTIAFSPIRMRAPHSLVMAVVATMMCGAAAHSQQCTSSQYGSFNQGNYTVQNDEWGLGNTNGQGGFEQVCPGSASNNSWSATWNWPAGNGALKAYPSIISGGNSFGSWTPNRNGFPVQISSNAPLATSVTFNMVGNNQFDTAYDLFFSPSTNPSSPSAEMMVWLNESGNQPAGSDVATVSIPGEPGSWKVWQGNVGWPVWSFESTSQITSFSSNLQPFIYYLAYTRGWLSPSWYEINTEFGTEITNSFGANGGINVTSFSATAQGSGGGTTGGGGAIANGTYTMTPACASGSRLDDTAGNTTPGTHLQIWTAAGNSNQNWTFANVGGSTYSAAVNGSNCLDSGGTTANGGAATIWTCNGNNNQKWTAHSVSGGYTFTAGNSGLCLDVSGAGTANGTAVDTWSCNGTGAQTWSL